ncbi:hypothetical protein E4U58_000944 [Claviceps cyperi]|nr:hypothetical protein E4U58_000944 [Claviceps cyperi]
MGSYRALTDNDGAGPGREWRDGRLHQTRPHTQQVQFNTANMMANRTGRSCPRHLRALASRFGVDKVERVRWWGRGPGESYRDKKQSQLRVAARFADLEGASFEAPWELRRRRRSDTLVRLDWAHHGVGTASCGPWTLPQYSLRTDRGFDFDVVLD